MNANDIPEFKTKEEEDEWRILVIAESIKNLATEVRNHENLLARGANMYKYKIPGELEYSNLVEVFDALFYRINKLEEIVKNSASVPD
tara:strand:+ start:4214 stop:4477 length:264 start_codon:yes stop_codon:yes gene_type:complete